MKIFFLILSGLLAISLGVECITAYEQTRDPVTFLILALFAALVVGGPWVIWHLIVRKRQK